MEGLLFRERGIHIIFYDYDIISYDYDSIKYNFVVENMTD